MPDEFVENVFRKPAFAAREAVRTTGKVIDTATGAVKGVLGLGPEPTPLPPTREELAARGGTLKALRVGEPIKKEELP